MLLFFIYPITMRVWPRGVFRATVYQQVVTVRTGETFGNGQIETHGWINANDNFTVNNDTITFGETLTTKLERFNIEITDIEIFDDGGRALINFPFGKFNISMVKIDTEDLTS